jgi:hypothetical protein
MIGFIAQRSSGAHLTPSFPSPADFKMDYLSLYELEQKHAIAAWKSERPSFLQSVAALWNPLTHRVTRGVERALIEHALDDFDRLALRSSGLAEVARLASVTEITQLRYSPLNECDRLAGRICSRSRRVFPGSANSFDSPRGTQSGSDIPPLLISALRLVSRIGHCYGYRLDDAHDRHLLIGILDYANQPDTEIRFRRQDRLVFPRLSSENEFEGLDLETSHAGAQLMTTEEFPADRSSRNTYSLDYGFLNRVAESARRVFQEQWLVDNGKTDPISPSSRHRRSSLDDFGRAMGHAAYVVGGAIGFGAVFPVVALSRIFAHGDRPAARGARDGAEAAARHADQLISGILGEDGSEADALPIPALRVMLG